MSVFPSGKNCKDLKKLVRFIPRYLKNKPKNPKKACSSSFGLISL